MTNQSGGALPPENGFRLVGIREPLPAPAAGQKRKPVRRLPLSGAFLLLLFAGCLFCSQLAPKDPAYLDLTHCSQPPGREFWFGTDTLGRDIFSMIWYGGRLSLTIGFLSAAVSAGIGIVLGTLSGRAPSWLDALLMRFTEIFLSIPTLLLSLLLQAAMGEASALSLSLVIGLTGWPGIAKLVRIQVLQLSSSDYVAVSRCMGGSFFHILRKHLTPNFISSIMFMIVMNIRSAIAAESTLSFLGIGLPVQVISWGSMLSLAQQAFLTDAWWILLIPGAFLVLTLLWVTDIGNRLRREENRKHSNL